MIAATTVRVAIGDLEREVAAALIRAGTQDDAARSVAGALVAAEVDGQKGHGLSRVASYVAQVRVGKVMGQARPQLHFPKPGLVQVDAQRGFAYPALDLALDHLPAVARTQGIAAAAIVRSHHAGMLGRVVERLAEHNLVALMFANTPSAMAAWGGRRAIYGTNPIAFAWPRRGRPPLVVDLALSEVARGRILAAAQAGDPIPEGWAVDVDGRPTTDAKAALAGTLLPSGGPKGAALALMVELLAVGLTGQSLAFEASSFLDAEGGPPDVGQLVVAIDAAAFAAEGLAQARLEAIASAIAADAGARLPGERRLARRQTARRDGVEVDRRLLTQLQTL